MAEDRTNAESTRKKTVVSTTQGPANQKATSKVTTVLSTTAKTAILKPTIWKPTRVKFTLVKPTTTKSITRKETGALNAIPKHSKCQVYNTSPSIIA